MTELAMDAAATAPNRRPTNAVRGALTFIVPQEKKPEFHSSALTGGDPKVFFEVEERFVDIADMRERADEFTVEHEGFELVRSETAVADLYDDDAVQTTYYREIEELLLERFGASRVVIFDATRRSDGGEGAANPDGRRGPARRVHVDYTAKSGPQRVSDVLGEDEAKRLQSYGARIVQVNVWRPISGPIKRAPLALADASSVGRDELVATDQVFPDRVGEIYHLAHAPTQKWYFAPDMTPDEIILIKGWDSLEDGRAQYTPHGAFELADTTPDTPARESIEVRTLVIIE
ncbi:MAG: CmcJ/NvfI family oxidoreductase [Hyphomicrobiaceae bacterium]